MKNKNKNKNKNKGIDLRDLRPKGQKISTSKSTQGAAGFYDLYMIQELSAEISYLDDINNLLRCSCSNIILMRNGCQCGGK
jgi:hypothetical protein